MSVLDKVKETVVDDTVPLICSITGAETVSSHTVSVIFKLVSNNHTISMQLFN